MKKRRIVLYGNTIIIGTIGSSLRLSSQYDVISLLPSQENDLKSIAPDGLIFDLESTRPEAAFSLLESCPGLLLIGISPDTNLVKVWTSQQLRELSTRGLLEVISEQLKNPSANLDGNDGSFLSKYRNETREKD